MPRCLSRAPGSVSSTSAVRRVIIKEHADRVASLGFDLPTREWLQATACGDEKLTRPPASMAQLQPGGMDSEYIVLGYSGPYGLILLKENIVIYFCPTKSLYFFS